MSFLNQQNDNLSLTGDDSESGFDQMHPGFLQHFQDEIRISAAMANGAVTENGFGGAIGKLLKTVAPALPGDEAPALELGSNSLLDSVSADSVHKLNRLHQDGGDMNAGSFDCKLFDAAIGVGGNSSSFVFGSIASMANDKQGDCGGCSINSLPAPVKRSSSKGGACGKFYRKAKEPPLNITFPSRIGSYELCVLKQPEEQHRARYLTEGSRGTVKDQSGHGHPTVKLNGFDQPVLLQIFVGTDVGKLKPHGFYQACKVSNKNSTACVERDIEGTTVIEIALDPKLEMVAVVDCVGILKLRNADVEQRIGLAKSKKKSTCSRLVFRVNIPKQDGTFHTLQVASTPIICTQPTGAPEISKKSINQCSAKGGEELFIIGKNFMKGTVVYFEEVKNDQPIWSKEADIDQDFFQATHLVCTVPSYRCLNIKQPVQIQIVIHSSGRSSDPVSFTYLPTDNYTVLAPDELPSVPMETETTLLKSTLQESSGGLKRPYDSSQQQQQQMNNGMNLIKSDNNNATNEYNSNGGNMNNVVVVATSEYSGDDVTDSKADIAGAQGGQSLFDAPPCAGILSAATPLDHHHPTAAFILDLSQPVSSVPCFQESKESVAIPPDSYENLFDSAVAAATADLVLSSRHDLEMTGGCDRLTSFVDGVHQIVNRGARGSLTDQSPTAEHGGVLLLGAGGAGGEQEEEEEHSDYGEPQTKRLAASTFRDRNMDLIIQLINDDTGNTDNQKMEPKDEMSWVGVTDSAGNFNIGGVSDGAGNFSIGGVSDGAGNFNMGGVSDGAGNFNIGGVSDGTGNFSMGGVSDVAGNFNISGVSDGASNFSMGGVSDGAGNFNIGGVSDGAGNFTIGRVTDNAGNFNIGVSDNTGNFNIGVSDNAGNFNIGVSDNAGNFNIGVSDNVSNFTIGVSDCASNFTVTEPVRHLVLADPHGANRQDLLDDMSQYSVKTFPPSPPASGAMPSLFDIQTSFGDGAKTDGAGYLGIGAYQDDAIRYANSSSPQSMEITCSSGAELFQDRNHDLPMSFMAPSSVDGGGAGGTTLFGAHLHCNDLCGGDLQPIEAMTFGGGHSRVEPSTLSGVRIGSSGHLVDHGGGQLVDRGVGLDFGQSDFGNESILHDLMVSQNAAGGHRGHAADMTPSNDDNNSRANHSHTYAAAAAQSEHRTANYGHLVGMTSSHCYGNGGGRDEITEYIGMRIPAMDSILGIVGADSGAATTTDLSGAPHAIGMNGGAISSCDEGSMVSNLQQSLSELQDLQQQIASGGGVGGGGAGGGGGLQSPPPAYQKMSHRVGGGGDKASASSSSPDRNLSPKNEFNDMVGEGVVSKSSGYGNGAVSDVDVSMTMHVPHDGLPLFASSGTGKSDSLSDIYDEIFRLMAENDGLATLAPSEPSLTAPAAGADPPKNPPRLLLCSQSAGVQHRSPNLFLAPDASGAFAVNGTTLESSGRPCPPEPAQILGWIPGGANQQVFVPLSSVVLTAPVTSTTVAMTMPTPGPGSTMAYGASSSGADPPPLTVAMDYKQLLGAGRKVVCLPPGLVSLLAAQRERCGTGGAGVGQSPVVFVPSEALKCIRALGPTNEMPLPTAATTGSAAVNICTTTDGVKYVVVSSAVAQATEPLLSGREERFDQPMDTSSSPFNLHFTSETLHPSSSSSVAAAATSGSASSSSSSPSSSAQQQQSLVSQNSSTLLYHLLTTNDNSNNVAATPNPTHNAAAKAEDQTPATMVLNNLPNLSHDDVSRVLQMTQNHQIGGQLQQPPS